MSFFSKVKSALSKTANSISKIGDVFTKKTLSAEQFEDFEERLLSVDFGIETTDKIIKELRNFRSSEENSELAFREKLQKIIFEIISDSEKELEIIESKLNIILFCGVNGNGKTTTIGKLAHKFAKEGKKVAVAACDTFRSAAIDQLKIWAERSGAYFISGNEGADPASVAFKAIDKAKEISADILLIDTAGRLQNRSNLMDELLKIIKIIKKQDETAPHHTILTLDATTGQNAFNQAEKFIEIASINGVIFTKLDGTARGGAIVGVVDKYKLPIYFLSIGESIDDIVKFDATEFSKALIG